MHAVAVGGAWLLIGNNHHNAALLISVINTRRFIAMPTMEPNIMLKVWPKSRCLTRLSKRDLLTGH
jgi:hypothetical protein